MDKRQEQEYNAQQNVGLQQFPQQQNVAGSSPPAYGAPPPGYVATTAAPLVGTSPNPYVTQQTTVTTQNKTPSGLRTAIPELPMALAVTLCVVNCILPGVGTIIAGFSVLCCGNVGQSGGGRFGTFCINFWVGLLQLGLTLFFFIGWIWSIMWGIAFIAIASEANKKVQTTTTTTITTAPGHPVTTVGPNATATVYSSVPN